jgi:hypothetical protein
MLSPVKVLIDILEGGDYYPTSNFINPCIGIIIDSLYEDKPTYTDYKGKREVIKVRTCFIDALVVRKGCVLNHYLVTLGGRISPEDS